MTGWATNFRSGALLTDLYQLTMAYGYWRAGKADTQAAFHLFFRRLPFGGGFAVASGLESVVRYVSNFRFEPQDLAYLATLRDDRGLRLLPDEFLDLLAHLRLTVNLDAVPEGTPVFPGEPLLRVEGPILQCQLLETPLLNLVNFQTLVATKAARVCLAARGKPVLEFGLRRAQGPDGALSASRAAYVGGAAATSNVLAGRLFGIPVKGTHAHSWVMFFDNEREAFEKWLEAMPGNSVLLLDTFDALEGARNAAAVGRESLSRGGRVSAVRIDSGDLARLSVEVRRILDEAGLEDTKIVASGDLDEEKLEALADAPIDVWGVGTRLVTAFDDPALEGVYKLGAVRRDGAVWQPVLKLSHDGRKRNLPGRVRIRRYREHGRIQGDVLYDEDLGPTPDTPPVTGTDAPSFRPEEAEASEELLVPILRGGLPTYDLPSLEEIRARSLAELEALPEGVRSLRPKQHFPVALDAGYHGLIQDLERRAGTLES